MASFKKANIILGHYGCGKTNFTANAALSVSDENTAVIDLDMVNPYFRSADFGELFSKQNIDLFSPNFANTNLDIPSFNFDPLAVIENHTHTFIDVGGDGSGAFALGRFSNSLLKLGDDLSVYFVLNMYRDTKDDIDETIQLLKETEIASRIKCTALVNNSNLGVQTNFDTILNSIGFAQKVSEKTNLPVAFTCVDEKFRNDKNINKAGSNILFTKRIVKLPWESLVPWEHND